MPSEKFTSKQLTRLDEISLHSYSLIKALIIIHFQLQFCYNFIDAILSKATGSRTQKAQNSASACIVVSQRMQNVGRIDSCHNHVRFTPLLFPQSSAISWGRSAGKIVSFFMPALRAHSQFHCARQPCAELQITTSAAMTLLLACLQYGKPFSLQERYTTLLHSAALCACMCVQVFLFKSPYKTTYAINKKRWQSMHLWKIPL